jgi:SAM-dependent methyltransferase
MNRYEYQKQFFDFDLKPGDRILDAGSGADPFSHATHLVDLFLESCEHRHTSVLIDERPFIKATVQALPFPDKYFDFVYCVHTLEHVNDPLSACSELARVGKRGFIETPTLAKDMLYSRAEGQHRWHVIAIDNRLCFFEYSKRQLKGLSSKAWWHIIQSPYHNPLQEAYYRNLDMFNVMFSWRDEFDVHVFRLDGTVERTSK